LTVAVSSFGDENLDPTQNTLAGIGTTGAEIYDWLTWPDKAGTIGPGLASSWKVSQDQLTWTVTLRPGLKFSNGESITASDVVFSMEREIAPTSITSFASLWRAKIKSVQATSTDTVQVALNSPWPTFPDALSPYEGTLGIVLPEAYFNSVGEAGFVAHPIGSGPWEFTGHTLGVDYTYKANPHPAFRPTPHYKNLEVSLVTDDTTRMAELESGQASIVETLPSDVGLIHSQKDQVLSIPNYTQTAVTFFGWGDPADASYPTSKLDVREALSLAINRTQLVKKVLAGYGTVPARFIVGPGSLGFQSSWKPAVFNPTKAKELLAKAGYPHGFTMTLYSAPIPGAAWIPDAVTAVAGYWQAIGVKTNIIPTDYGTLSTLYRVQPVSSKLLGAAMINISQVTKTNLSLLQAYYPAGSPVSLLPSPEMTILSGEANSAFTLASLAQALDAMVDYANSQYVAAPLAITPSLYGAASNVKGWSPYVSGYIGMSLESVS
jgi:peptide/nickel transport system substrate-binding protein